MTEQDGSRTRWVVSFCLAATFIYRADALTTRMIVGGIVSAIGVKIAKRLFRQPRPPGSTLKDGGMPSSHAQSLFFFATFISAHCWSVDWWPVVSSVVLLSIAFWQSARRVKMGLHTKEQIAVGTLMGVFNGLLWFHKLGPFFVPFIPSLFNDTLWRWIAVVVLLFTGFLTVGSVERWLRGPPQPSRSSRTSSPSS